MSSEARRLQPGEAGLAVAAKVAFDEHGKALAADGLVVRATVASKGSIATFTTNSLEVRDAVPR